MNAEKTKKIMVLIVGIVAIVGVLSLFFSASSDTVGAAIVVGADTDGDGIPDRIEKTVTRTDYRNPDTDGDGLTDGEEYNTYDCKLKDADTDDDGLGDGEEVAYGSDCRDTDSDDDGITDGDEVNSYSTDPMDADTDDDGLTDYDEIFVYSTIPWSNDSDGDGILDGEDECFDDMVVDLNGDGLPAVCGTQIYFTLTGEDALYVLDTSGSLKWYYDMGILFVYNTPIVTDSAVYIIEESSSYGTSGSDGYDTIYAFDIGTGTLLWSYDAISDDERSSSPTAVVVDDTLYIGTDDRTIEAFDALTGASLWTGSVSGDVSDNINVVDGIVYAGTNVGVMDALDAATGTLLWGYATGGDIFSPPLVAEGIVYIEGDEIFSALDATTGSLLWSYTFYPSATSASIQQKSIVEGILYLCVEAYYSGTFDQEIVALDATTGSLLWSYSLGDNGGAYFTINDGSIYASTTTDDSLYVLDTTSGSLLWSYATGVTNFDDEPAVANGVVYINADDTLLALDTSTGSLLWSYTVAGSYIAWTPIISGDTVYVDSTFSAENLYALDPTTGTLLWTYSSSTATSDFISASYVIQ